MSFCLLTDGLPDTALGLPIRTDFRQMIRFQNRLVRAPESEWAQLVAQTVQELFGPRGLQDLRRAWDALLWFYCCGQKEEPGRPGPSEGAAVRAPAYDYAVDGPLIAAAFRQAYGIDLADPALILHWWSFRALFEGLPECRFTQIMYYRTADTADMPDYERRHVEKMREKYALPGEIGGVPHYATLEEREAAFLARLPGCQ